MPYRSLTNNRVCAYTCVNEKDLPIGQKLMNCGRCGEVCYIDRESQLAHWPVHKKVCCSIEKDDPRIRNDSIWTFHNCLETIGWILIDPDNRITGRLFLYMFQKLRQFFEEDPEKYFVPPEDADPSQPEIPMTERLGSRLINRFIDPLQKKIHQRKDGIKTLKLLWAIPGFVNYFLDPDIFLSKFVKSSRDKDGKVPESIFSSTPALKGILAIFRDDLSVIQTIETLKLDKCRYIPSWYYGMVEMLFNISAMNGYTGHLLPGPLTLSLGRLLGKSMICPFVKESFPQVAYEAVKRKPWTTRSHYLIIYFRRFHRNVPGAPSKNWTSDDELTLGVTLKDIIREMTTDQCLWINMSEEQQQDFHAILSFCAMNNQDIGPWKQIGPIGRIEILDYLADIPGLKLSAEESKRGEARASDIVRIFVTGRQTKYMLQMADALDELAASRSPVKQSTARYIQAHRKSILVDVLPLVKIYIDAVEPRYLQHAASAGFDPLPMPDEVIERIAEFAAPIEYSKTALSQRVHWYDFISDDSICLGGTKKDPIV